MAFFDIIGSYPDGSIVDGPELSAEFENIYDAFNGNSTNKEINHKFNGSQPAIIIDQLGSGPIAEFKLSGITVLTIANDGKIVNPNVIKDKYDWFINTPTSLDTDRDEKQVFIVPSGVSMAIKKFSIIRRSGSHTTGGVLAYRLIKVNGGVLLGNGEVQFNDTNAAADTEFSDTFTFNLTAGDIIGLSQITHSGTVSELGITCLMEWEQRLG